MCKQCTRPPLLLHIPDTWPRSQTFSLSSFWSLTACKQREKVWSIQWPSTGAHWGIIPDLAMLLGVFYYANDVNVYLGRQGGGRSLIKRMHFGKRSLSWTMSRKFPASQTFGTPALGQTLQGKASNSVLTVRDRPVYQVDIEVIHIINGPGLPLLFWHTVSNQKGRRGNEAIQFIGNVHCVHCVKWSSKFWMVWILHNYSFLYKLSGFNFTSSSSSL